jgi:hypothetical protein
MAGCGIREKAATRNFVLWLFLNYHNVLWHVMMRHDAKVVSWLLKEMIRTGSEYHKVFGTAQRIGLGNSPLTEDAHSSIETEELEQVFNEGMNSVRGMEDKEEANQHDRKDEDKIQTSYPSEETV